MGDKPHCAYCDFTAETEAEVEEHQREVMRKVHQDYVADEDTKSVFHGEQYEHTVENEEGLATYRVPLAGLKKTARDLDEGDSVLANAMMLDTGDGVLLIVADEDGNIEIGKP